MAQNRHFHMGGGDNAGGMFGDTTYTKIFVGGLAWETQRETMRRYFEQFGEIQEAVIITDKNTGRSKGYGFVTFKEPDSATKSCQNPNPVIDGRRANCNLAILGAANSRSRITVTPQQGFGYGRYRQSMGGSSPAPIPAYHTSSAMAAPTCYIQQPSPQMPQYTYPYSVYGYSGGYSRQEGIYPMSYYNYMSGAGQHQQHQFPPYYTGGASSASGLGMYPSFYNPYYTQYTQSGNGSNGSGGVYGLQYPTPQMLQYSSYAPQQYATTGILSPPSSTITSVTGVTMTVVTIGPHTPSIQTTTASEPPPPSASTITTENPKDSTDPQTGPPQTDPPTAKQQTPSSV